MAGAQIANGTRGMIATGHPLATQAGVHAFEQGGNAIDAAIAAALMLGVVDGHNSGIGGGCFILIRLASGECVAIDGRETAPAAASRDMFVRNGKGKTELSQTGALAAGTPGALAAYDAAAQRYAKRPLADHLRFAADVAENGFRIDAAYAKRLKATAAELSAFPEARRIFLGDAGHALEKGAMLKQPDLAKTYRYIADQGIGWFYRGSFAQTAEKWMKENHGLLRLTDFQSYQPKFREPLRNTYREFEIVGFPPPSSGGVHVAQLLNILEQFDLGSFRPGSADFIHLASEAMKLAFADRAFWLGDPDFVRVPRELVGKKYGEQLARLIDRQHATKVSGHGMPDSAAENFFEKHTTHFSTADAEGNWVACTATINTSFGSKVVIPGTGVLLNNEMDDFAIQPGVPNAFGLVGGEANSIAPGKRPLSSMSPTIVLKDGVPILSLGAAGGPTIISQTLLAVINVIDFAMPLEGALRSGRFHHQWEPDELEIERSIDANVREELRRRGHKLSEEDTFGACQAVGRSPDGSHFIGVPDPRNQGEARGW